ncbi:MAG: NUDIX domain-containing protein [Candidatus Spechtbacterales bacterium]
MTKDGEKLNIVNKKGEIIGEATREDIHEKGLLHREVHVWLYTPDCKIIFQHRAKDKDTYPDLLDASVGGHVEIGDSFETAAVKELEEEASIEANIDELQYILTMRGRFYDEITGMTNNVLRAIYVFQ